MRLKKRHITGGTKTILDYQPLTKSMDYFTDYFKKKNAIPALRFISPLGIQIIFATVAIKREEKRIENRESKTELETNE